VDKCDESVTSQTTISINVAFDRIWMLVASMERSTKWKDFACISRSRCHTKSRLTVCPFRCTNRQQIPTFASWMQANSPLWAGAASTLWPAHGVLTFLHATRSKQSIVRDVIVRTIANIREASSKRWALWALVEAASSRKCSMFHVCNNKTTNYYNSYIPWNYRKNDICMKWQTYTRCCKKVEHFIFILCRECITHVQWAM